jgi:chorismate mutase
MQAGVVVPMLCASEIAVQDAMPGVIRMLAHIYNPDYKILHHVYLDGTEQLLKDK